MSDRVVVVTGGGRGIGRAVCVRFGSGGAQVVAASRSTEELAETCRLVEAAGGACHACRTDVADPSQIDALIDETVDRFGTVDVLVNAAGVAPCEGILDLDPEVFDGGAKKRRDHQHFFGGLAGSVPRVGGLRRIQGVGERVDARAGGGGSIAGDRRVRGGPGRGGDEDAPRRVP